MHLISAVLGDFQFDLRRCSKLQADMSQCLGEVRWPLAVTSRVWLAAHRELMFPQRAGSCCSSCSSSSCSPSRPLANWSTRSALHQRLGRLSFTPTPVHNQRLASPRPRASSTLPSLLSPTTSFQSRPLQQTKCIGRTCFATRFGSCPRPCSPWSCACRGEGAGIRAPAPCSWRGRRPSWREPTQVGKTPVSRFSLFTF